MESILRKLVDKTSKINISVHKIALNWGWYTRPLFKLLDTYGLYP